MRDHHGQARVPLLSSPGGRQLLSALGLPASPQRSPPSMQHSPRPLSNTILKTCAAIAGLVVLNAILAACIFSAVQSFSRSNNKIVQPTTVNNLKFMESTENGQVFIQGQHDTSYVQNPPGLYDRSQGAAPNSLQQKWWSAVMKMAQPSGDSTEDDDWPAKDSQPSGQQWKEYHEANPDPAIEAQMDDSEKADDMHSASRYGVVRTPATDQQDAVQRGTQDSNLLAPVEEFYMTEDETMSTFLPASAGPGAVQEASRTAAPAPSPEEQPVSAAADAADTIASVQLTEFAAAPAPAANLPAAGVSASPEIAVVPAALDSDAAAEASEGAAVTALDDSEQIFASEASQADAALTLDQRLHLSEGDSRIEHSYSWPRHSASLQSGMDIAAASIDDIADALHAQDRIHDSHEAGEISGQSAVAAFGEMYTAENVAGSPEAAPAEGVDDNDDRLPVEAPAPGPQDLPDPCAAALNLPKVAIMFLSKAELFHESSWALWFQHAAGLLPIEMLQAQQQDADGEDYFTGRCDEDRIRLAQQWCTEYQGPGVLQRQHLFNVYIHPLPDFGSFPEESIFRGREIEDRIQVSWGAHELVLAARNLLGAALSDQLNQKFLLLSESGIPLYPPTTTYLQLMSEDKSRLDSCGIGRTDPWRYTWRMGPKLKQHWRKSSQWFALTRRHAELVMADAHVLELFQKHCQNAWDNDYNRWRDCFSDEHYMPSLIAYLQLGHETDCVGHLVHVDWSTGGAHPRSYGVEDVNPDMIESLREWDDRVCDYEEAMRSSTGLFMHTSELQRALDSSEPACDVARSYNSTALGYDCPIFARKFPRDTASAVYNLLRGCSTGLNITNTGECPEGDEDIPDQRVSKQQSSHRMRELKSSRRMRELKGLADDAIAL